MGTLSESASGGFARTWGRRLVTLLAAAVTSARRRDCGGRALPSCATDRRDRKRVRIVLHAARRAGGADGRHAGAAGSAARRTSRDDDHFVARGSRDRRRGGSARRAGAPGVSLQRADFMGGASSGGRARTATDAGSNAALRDRGREAPVPRYLSPGERSEPFPVRDGDAGRAGGDDSRRRLLARRTQRRDPMGPLVCGARLHRLRRGLPPRSAGHLESRRAGCGLRDGLGGVARERLPHFAGSNADHRAIGRRWTGDAGGIRPGRRHGDVELRRHGAAAEGGVRAVSAGRFRDGLESRYGPRPNQRATSSTPATSEDRPSSFPSATA